MTKGLSLDELADLARADTNNPITKRPAGEVREMIQLSVDRVDNLELSEALLAENDIGEKRMLRTFNEGTRHAAKFSLRQDSVIINVTARAPSPNEKPADVDLGYGVEIRAVDGPDGAVFKGKVKSVNCGASQFEVVAKCGEDVLLPEERDFYDGRRMDVRVKVKPIDSDSKQQIEAFHRAIALELDSPETNLQFDDEPHRGFHFPDFVCGNTYAPRGIDFVELWKTNAADNGVTADEQATVLELVLVKLPQWATYTREQRDFYFDALGDPKAGMISLEG